MFRKQTFTRLWHQIRSDQNLLRLKSNPRFLPDPSMAYGGESISGDTSTSAFQRRLVKLRLAICVQQWGSSYAEQADPRVYNGATINERTCSRLVFDHYWTVNRGRLTGYLWRARMRCKGGWSGPIVVVCRLVCITMAHGPSSNVHAPIFGSYQGLVSPSSPFQVDKFF